MFSSRREGTKNSHIKRGQEIKEADGVAGGICNRVVHQANPRAVVN